MFAGLIVGPLGDSVFEFRFVFDVNATKFRMQYVKTICVWLFLFAWFRSSVWPVKFPCCSPGLTIPMLYQT